MIKPHSFKVRYITSGMTLFLVIVAGFQLWQWKQGAVSDSVPTVVSTVFSSDSRHYSCEGVPDSSVEILLGRRDLIYKFHKHKESFACRVRYDDNEGAGSVSVDYGSGSYPLLWNSSSQALASSTSEEFRLDHIAQGEGRVYHDENIRLVDAVYICGSNEFYLRVNVGGYAEGTPAVENVKNLIASMLPELCGVEASPGSGAPSESSTRS